MPLIQKPNNLLTFTFPNTVFSTSPVDIVSFQVRCSFLDESLSTSVCEVLLFDIRRLTEPRWRLSCTAGGITTAVATATVAQGGTNPGSRRLLAARFIQPVLIGGTRAPATAHVINQTINPNENVYPHMASIRPPNRRETSRKEPKNGQRDSHAIH